MTERIQKSALPLRDEILSTIHVTNQMFVFIFFCPLCRPGCGGQPHHCWGCPAAQPSLIKAAWQRAAAFSKEYRTISQLPANRLNHSTVCFDQASLPKHLDGASDKRCSEKELAACPAAAEEFEWGEGDGGDGGCVISSGRRDAANLSDLKKLYRCKESTLLLTTGGRRGSDRLSGFWKVLLHLQI